MPVFSNHPDDTVLFRRIAEGDEQAFETIFHRYTPKLRPFVFATVKVGALADELVQEVFLKLWLNRENLLYVNDPAGWLFRVASNLALNQLRKQATEYKHLKQAISAAGVNPADILEEISTKELQQLIYEAVNKLPRKRKEIYMLSREAGLSHKEIAEKLQISSSTVKNQVVSALKSIQDYILDSRGVYIPLILLTGKIISVSA